MHLWPLNTSNWTLHQPLLIELHNNLSIYSHKSPDQKNLFLKRRIYWACFSVSSWHLLPSSGLLCLENMDNISFETVIVVACICGTVIAVLSLVLVILCCKRCRAKSKKEVVVTRMLLLIIVRRCRKMSKDDLEWWWWRMMIMQSLRQKC